MVQNSNSTYNRILNNLRFLKSNESLDVLDKTIDYVTHNKLSFIEGFLYFTEAQMEKKRENLMKHAVKAAGFPKIKTLIEFDFDYQPTINKEQIEDFNSLRFNENKENIVFFVFRYFIFFAIATNSTTCIKDYFCIIRTFY